MRLNFFSLCFSTLILLVSCTKEEVAPSGSSYQNNYNYSTEVNVIASNWVSASSLIWSDATAASDSTSRTDWGAGVTQEVIDNGAVLIYARTNSDGLTKPLPASFYNNDVDFESYSTVTEPYSIQLAHSSYRDGAFRVPTLNDDISFRYIVIENASSANGRIETSDGVGYSIQDLKYMNYDDVVSLLNIDK